MVAKGLADLHKQNVIHRDIKSDNILCARNGQIKITDLGCSVLLHKEKAHRCTRIGTGDWYAPEIIHGVAYSKEIDVWSFGIFAYELASGQPPFRLNVKRGQSIYDAILHNEIPRIPERWSGSFDALIQ